MTPPSKSSSLTHYRDLLSTPFYRWMYVSLVTGAAVVLITLLIAVPAAYSLARLEFPGNRGIGIAIFLTYLIRPTILFIPYSQFVGALHVSNTIWALILSYPTFTIPFCTWLLTGRTAGSCDSPSVPPRSPRAQTSPALPNPDQR